MNSHMSIQYKFPVERLRKGQSLLLVFLMLVAIVGILALTLDFGFVILARRQMQTGVNTAALEGLRNVDTDPVPDNLGDGRASARRLIRNVFDDDMDPSANETTVGAGISSSLVSGDGYRQTTLGNGISSRNLYQNQSSFIYRPEPQLNESNQVHGDFVAGAFDDLATLHEESADYSRTDFQPSAANTEIEKSFLVRLRRTHNPNGLDNLAGVSSSDGGLPLLIGRLAWFSSTSANANYSIRRDGVTVRATAIADAKFTVRVWPVSSSIETYGALAFGISKDDFINQASLAPHIRPTVDPNSSAPITPTRFGQVVSLSNTGSFAGEGYVAVIDEALTPNRVIGFIRMPNSALPTRQPNSSSRISDVWDVYGELTNTEKTSLIDSRQDAADRSPHRLLTSPTLVRSIR